MEEIHVHILKDVGNRPKLDIHFSRLSFQEIPKIGKFLISTWRKDYGKVGSPVFSEDYLQWVLGGPNKDRHILLGCKINNELVAYQTFLFRRVSYRGVKLNGYLNTHGAISPYLSTNLKFNCAMQMGRQHALFHESTEFFCRECDLVYAFYDEGKHLKDVLDKGLKKYLHVERKVLSIFNQCMVLPDRLKEYLSENSNKKASREVKPASEKHVRGIAALFNSHPSNLEFTILMTEDELRHHFFGHPGHHTDVVENNGDVEAFINYYPLEIFKEKGICKYVVIEFLGTREPDGVYIASLLGKALDFGEKIGAKAVVLENATYLDNSICCQVGLVASFRKMVMTVACPDPSMEFLGRFRSDVK